MKRKKLSRSDFFTHCVLVLGPTATPLGDMPYPERMRTLDEYWALVKQEYGCVRYSYAEYSQWCKLERERCGF